MSAVLDTCIRVLNEALAADRTAITTLLAERTPCNRDLADHPTVQVRHIGDQWYEVGTLGLINGLVEASTGARIAAQYAENGDLVGFIKYESPK